MENNKQPQHTQEQLKVSETTSLVDNFQVFINTEDGFCRAQVYGETEEQAKTSAKRIVKVVNMHDELVEGLKIALNIFARGYEPKEGAKETAGSRTYLQLSELLKQAEQK